MKAARAFSAPLVVAVLLFSSLSVAGSTAWKETAADFPSGQNVNTHVEGGALALEKDPALAGNWTKMGDLSSPPPRCQHSMVYAPADGVHLLFGGFYSTDYRNDTWTYNATSNKWTAQPAPAIAPKARTGQAMAFDTRSNIAVMFGGFDGTNKADTWEYNYSINYWQEWHPMTAPESRAFHSMAYDPVSNLIVLFGGRRVVGGYQYSYYNDTWTYNYATGGWTNATPSISPSQRYGQSMCYDATSKLIVLFGGRNGTDVYRDTWTYNPSTNIWINRNPPTNPAARSGAAMADDTFGGAVVLFGGQGDSTATNDTWSYNATANTWTNKLLAGGPSSRGCPAMTYDPASRKMILFGGQEQGGDYMDDCWSYDPAQNSWVQLGELSSPSPRMGSAAIFDRGNKVGILFGGTDGIFFYNDTWTYDASKNLWARKRPASPPPPRADHVMAYDRINGAAVLFGGTRGPTELGDTWTYSAATNIWTNRQPVSGPPAGGRYCMAYDPARGITVLFGGHGFSGMGNETWTYSITDNLWTNRTAAVAPPASTPYGMVYDDANRLLVLFGGARTGGLGDTWVYDTSTFTWTQMTPLNSPPARQDGGMVFDAGMGATLLFGGAGQTVYSDLWAFNASQGVWTSLIQAMTPSSRSSIQMFYDTTMNATALFGGTDVAGNIKGDTWLYNLSGRLTAGTYTSVARDTGGSAYFGHIQWESAAPAGTAFKLQLRTGATQADLEANVFTGPDGTGGTYYNASGGRIPMLHNGSRWVQYRAYLQSDSILRTPTLSSVTVNYNLLQSIAVTAPAGGENWTDQQSINWTSSDPDNDPLLIDIYLLNGTGSEPLALGIPAGDGSWLWDTTMEPNGTYRVMLVAHDDNAIIPLTANSTSGEFVLQHNGTGPPPVTNHPPVVLQISPIDGAALNLQYPPNVKLQWSATDADMDPLNYTVYLSNASFNLSVLPPPVAVTNQSTFNVINLVDNATYYWTVVASDGKATGSGAVWRFTVKIGIINIPPRLTSSPPANATAGVELVYQVTAVDDDGGNITYSLRSIVDGMVLNSTSGLLTWTPRPNQVGNVLVVINVSDGQGGYAEQRFTINVREPAMKPPTCTIRSPAQNQIVRGRFRVNGTAVNGSYGVLRVQVRVDGRDWKDAGMSAGNWSFEIDTRQIVNGPHLVESRAFDGRQYSEPASVRVQVRNPERDFVTSEFPMALLMLLLWLAGVAFLLWTLILRKGGPPRLT